MRLHLAELLLAVLAPDRREISRDREMSPGSLLYAAPLGEALLFVSHYDRIAYRDLEASRPGVAPWLPSNRTRLTGECPDGGGAPRREPIPKGRSSE